MRPSAHPAPDVLADYVTAALRPAFAVVVAAHVEGCAACRARLTALEAECGQLVDALPPAAMGDDALARVMAGIERRLEPIMAERRPAPDRIPFGRPRRLGLGVTIRKAQVEGQGTDLVYLLSVPSGVKVVLHGHGGEEFTAVLEGSFADGGETFRQGDFIATDPDIDHEPRALPPGRCVCLIASEAQMRPRGAIGRLVQWLAKV